MLRISGPQNSQPPPCHYIIIETLGDIGDFLKTAGRDECVSFQILFLTVICKGQVSESAPVSGLRWISASAFVGCTGAGMGLAIRLDIPAQINVAMAAVLEGVDAFCHGG